MTVTMAPFSSVEGGGEGCSQRLKLLQTTLSIQLTTFTDTLTRRFISGAPTPMNNFNDNDGSLDLQLQFPKKDSSAHFLLKK